MQTNKQKKKIFYVSLQDISQICLLSWHLDATNMPCYMCEWKGRVQRWNVHRGDRLSPKSIERVRSKVMAFHKKAFAVWFSQVGWWALFVTYTIIQSIMRSEMCSLHLTHPSVHTWSSGQPTVQRPGSSRGLPVGAGIRTHNLGLPQVSSPTLYPLGQRLPIEGVSPSRVAVQILHPCAVALPVEVLRGAGVCLTAFKLLATVFRVPSEHHIAHTHRECQSGYRPPRSSLFGKCQCGEFWDCCFSKVSTASGDSTLRV